MERAYIIGFISGMLCYAITFTVIHRYMKNAFKEAVDHFKEAIEKMFRENL